MKHSTFLAATAALALSAASASASTVDIEQIDANWQGAVGGTNVVYNNGDPVDIVSWGVPLVGTLNPEGLKSSYEFERRDLPLLGVPDGGTFSLGTFTHNNFEIVRGGGINRVDLAFTFGGSPSEAPDDPTVRPVVTFDAVFRFTHTETPNIGANCPDDDVPCNDLVDVIALDGQTESFLLGKTRYTFTLLGFGDTAEGAEFSRVFETVEGQPNSTQIWARVDIAVIPLPAAGWLLLGGLGALGAVARRRRKAA